MRRIRKRPIKNIMTSDLRKVSASFGHWVYYMMLLGTAGAFTWYLYGNKVFLQTEGVVIQEHVDIEAAATLTVVQVFVEPGDKVRAGQEIMRVKMPDKQLQMVELGERIRTLEIDQKRLEFISDEAKRQLPILYDQVKLVKDKIRRKQLLLKRGLITLGRLEEQQLRLQELEKEVARLEVRASEAPKQKHLRDLERQYDNLRKIIGDGFVRATVDGSVGKINVGTGTVATTGEQLMDIIYGNKYVLAYLDSEYLFPVDKGQVVHIKGGTTKVPGIIRSILPYSESLPEKHQKTMTKKGYSRLARVDIKDSPNLVMNQNVQVSLDPSIGKTLWRHVASLWHAVEPDSDRVVSRDSDERNAEAASYQVEADQAKKMPVMFKYETPFSEQAHDPNRRFSPNSIGLQSGFVPDAERHPDDKPHHKGFKKRPKNKQDVRPGKQMFAHAT